MNQNSSVRKLARCAVVAAIYVVLCLVLAPFSYGAVQVRVAEALCLLPVFGAEYIVGVTLGCFLANLLGSTVVDVVFGTLATLLACLVTYKLRDLRFKGLALAASLPPVLFNAVIIGIEINLLIVDFKLDVLNTNISSSCSCHNCLQHCFIFTALNEVLVDIGIVTGENNVLSEPAHRLNTGLVIHRAGNGEIQLVRSHCFAD